MVVKKSNIVHVSLKFLCPSVDKAEEFAEEVRGEFSEVSKHIPQMISWIIEKDGIVVRVKDNCAESIDPTSIDT